MLNSSTPAQGLKEICSLSISIRARIPGSLRRHQKRSKRLTTSHRAIIIVITIVISIVIIIVITIVVSIISKTKVRSRQHGRHTGACEGRAGPAGIRGRRTCGTQSVTALRRHHQVTERWPTHSLVPLRPDLPPGFSEASDSTAAQHVLRSPARREQVTSHVAAARQPAQAVAHRSRLHPPASPPRHHPVMTRRRKAAELHWT